MWKLGDKVIREGRGWVGLNGTKHSSLWGRMSDEEKKEAGLTYQPDPKTWDNRFYRGWDEKEENLIERSIDDRESVDSEGNKIKDEDGNVFIKEGLKTIAIRRCKETARSLLSKTDWYVTRKTDTGAAIPDTVGNYRTAVRTASKTIEDKINACDTHAKFMALYDTPLKDGKPTGNAPINDWPKEP